MRRDSGCRAFAARLTVTTRETPTAGANRGSARIGKIRKLILLIPTATDNLVSCESICHVPSDVQAVGGVGLLGSELLFCGCSTGRYCGLGSRRCRRGVRGGLRRAASVRR